jgi:adenosyl cobinamide kinase/adenosyl cobinamide phosphate guanylyltransferase
VITLVIGGTRSGKSEVAERLAGAGARAVTYVATARVDPADTHHVERIARHRARRPTGWTTVECPDPATVPDVLRRTAGAVLVDSLGTWLAGHEDLAAGTDDLVAALASRDDDTVVVSEEVGLSPHAPTELGRRFADQLGLVNQRVAAVADRVLLVVAGRTLELGAPGEPSC